MFSVKYPILLEHWALSLNFLRQALFTSALNNYLTSSVLWCCQTTAGTSFASFYLFGIKIKCMMRGWQEVTFLSRKSYLSTQWTSEVFSEARIRWYIFQDVIGAQLVENVGLSLSRLRDELTSNETWHYAFKYNLTIIWWKYLFFTIAETNKSFDFAWTISDLRLFNCWMQYYFENLISSHLFTIEGIVRIEPRFG